MKKKLATKILALTMAGTMAAGLLAGCAKETGNKADTKTSDGKTEAAADKPDTWIADRTIDVQVYVDDIGYTLPEDINSTPVMQELTKRTGIKLNIQYTPGDSDAKVLASQLAAGTIPDVIVTYLNDSTRPEFPLLLKAAKEGMFADVSEYMKNSKVYSKYYEDDYLPHDSKKNIVFRDDFNGSVYLMHLGIDEIDRSLEYIPENEYLGGPYIQKKIADELKIDPKEIRTPEQFYDLLVKIKQGGFKDDNGNDVWPLGPKFWGGSVDALKFDIAGLDWGVSDGYNLDENGNVMHEAETDHVYDKINYVRKLLNEGLMNPEFFTMDSTRAEEVSKTHNSAIIGDVHNYQEIIYGSDEWVPLGPLNDIQGDNKKVTHGKTANGAWAISADAENPEEIFKFFDYLSTKEGTLLCQYGVEGVSYNMEDGMPKLTDEVAQKLNEGDTDWLVNQVGAGMGGSGLEFFDFVLTNLNPLNNFGESRPGASSSTTFERSVEVAKEYPREKKLIEGLDATAYLSAEGMEDVKAQMDLLNYKEVLTQAFFAKDDAEVKSIIESFRAQLKSAGNDKFKDYLKKLYEEDKTAINFYS